MEEKVALNRNSIVQTLIDHKIKLTESNALLLHIAVYQDPHMVLRTVSDTTQITTVLILDITDKARYIERAGFQLTLPMIVVSFLVCHYFMEKKFSIVNESY